MSRLMRRVYGHGGTRAERIIVCAPPMDTSPTPLWLKIPVLILLLVLPFLIGHYAVPTATAPMRTLIDMSKLEVKPPPILLKKPEIPKPERIRPIERTVEPPPQPVPPLVQTPPKTVERKTVEPAPEVQRPTITRSQPSRPANENYQPRVARERRQIQIESGTTTGPTRLRREAVVGEAPATVTSITRSRGATAMESSVSKERVAVLRRTNPGGDISGGRSIGIGTSQGPTVIHRGRPSGRMQEEGEGAAPRVSASRERTKLAGRSGGDGGGEGSGSSVGVVRGVSLMSLEICSSAQLQEERIKDVLSVVGSRQSCRSDKGEFQFRGTKRISSFNLMIYPSQGRKPSNRCKELEYAYTCLTSH